MMKGDFCTKNYIHKKNKTQREKAQTKKKK